MPNQMEEEEVVVDAADLNAERAAVGLVKEAAEKKEKELEIKLKMLLI